MTRMPSNDWQTYSDCDKALAELDAAKPAWTRTSGSERVAILEAIKENLIPVAQGWAVWQGDFDPRK